MAPNAGDRHFRVFRVPASVFQVMVGGDGKPLADVLHDERAPMDALHRRPETTCSNARQCIRSIRTQRKTGRGRTPVTEPPPRVGAGPTIHGNGRPPVVPDGPPRRYGGGVLQKRGVSERKGQRGGGGGDVMAAVRGKGIPASYGGGGGGARVEDVPWRRSALFCLPQ